MFQNKSPCIISEIPAKVLCGYLYPSHLGVFSEDESEVRINIPVINTALSYCFITVTPQLKLFLDIGLEYSPVSLLCIKKYSRCSGREHTGIRLSSILQSSYSPFGGTVGFS